ncbi:unnamed protein product [Prorocentrum cordatum]|uniref:Uncharacterized protein n=1 Tax=Prorocentrum cordatum TaxID=2364126 RepID=A0ABN9RY62_9DINO|nr:unnamed protein product [Polarella glacialis]
MTEAQRDNILDCMRGLGFHIECKKAFTVNASPPIDFFPPKAQWHSKGIKVESPGAVRFDDGAKRAIKILKEWSQAIELSVRSKDLEELIFQIQRDKGWNAKNDRSGIKRCGEAKARLLSNLVDIQ